MFSHRELNFLVLVDMSNTLKSKIMVQNNADNTIVPTFNNFEAFVEEERNTLKALAFASYISICRFRFLWGKR